MLVRSWRMLLVDHSHSSDVKNRHISHVSDNDFYYDRNDGNDSHDSLTDASQLCSLRRLLLY